MKYANYDFNQKNVEKKKNKYDINLNKNKYSDEYLSIYYDIVFDIDSLENLKQNGWKIIKATENGYEKYLDKKNKNCTLVSVLGNKNTGKSFILSKISNYEIPDGFNISTKGLSIIYPLNDHDNVIFLDTPGIEDSLCEDDEVFKFNTNNEEYLNLSEEEKKSVSIKDYMYEDEYMTQIQKFTKDKELTNQFIKKFVIYYSNVNIYVIDSEMDLKEQNFYKYFLEDKKNIIIHNLKTFKEKREVENYIYDYLLKEVPISLEKIYFTNIDNYSDNYYFKQIIKGNKDIEVIHLIMANYMSEAGNYYNYSTIYFIKKIIETNSKLSKFDILEKVKEFLFEHSEEFFNEPLDNIDDIKIIDERLLKYTNKEKPFELKECYFDELENTKLVNSNYKPYYRVYKAKYKEENNEEIKLFIDLKISGIVKKLEFPRILEKNNQTILTIRGIRNIKIKNTGQKVVPLSEYKNNFFYDKNNIFNLRINIPNEKCLIKNLYKRIIYEDKGLYRFIYDIKD